MLERLWAGKSWWYILLLPFSWLYGLLSSCMRISYQWGLLKSWRAPLPVVVVGNLTVGGNGKTPLVIWLVENLLKRGLRVGVVSRGYGGHYAHYPLLLTADVSAAQAGDEPVLIYQRTGVPVAVAPKRVAAIQALLAHNTLDIIITDDGLQHYAMQRDFEIVVIDGMRRFGNGWWLPAGPMRERASRLHQVDACVTNGGVALANEIPMCLHACDAVNLVSGERCQVAALGAAVAIAGIGHPPRFFATLKKLGAKLISCVPFSDHQHYQKEQLAALTTQGQVLLMTEKDAVKCRSFALSHWWYLPVDAQLPPQQGNMLLQHIAALQGK